jgi:hypothetical protein
VDRIRRRVTLLENQLTSVKNEWALEREQHELDFQDTMEQNTRLTKQLAKATQAYKKASAKAAAAEASLNVRRQSEQKEAEVLEDFTARVETNLLQSNRRADAAEQQVQMLTGEVNRLRMEVQANSLNGGAADQVHAASGHLLKLAADSEKAIRELCKGVGTLQHVSDLLRSLDKFTD